MAANGGVLVDGIINTDEWTGASTSDTFMDLENGDGNVDGDFRIYLGKNTSHLLLGLDLSGDQTGDPAGEWVGVWLKWMNKNYTNSIEHASYPDSTAEALVFDVENNAEWNPISDAHSINYVTSEKMEFSSEKLNYCKRDAKSPFSNK